jgi:diguanylate cyclase (GGDEF)-like protein
MTEKREAPALRLVAPWVQVLTLAQIGVVALLDYLSGFEIRIYPLYYLPVAFAAWWIGRRWTIAAAAVSTLSWVASNAISGLTYSAQWVWVVNASMHMISFTVVGVLLAKLKVSLEQERALSRTDALTALLNARAFHEEGRRVLSEARRKARPLTVAYIDLDDFKAVNDRLGHHGGDDMLKRVASAIRGSIRISDIAARMGGDEFVLLLPETGVEAAGIAIGRLRAALSTSLATTEEAVTASIGAVVFELPPESLDQMIEVADRRMYLAKAEGKNRVRLDVESAPALGGARG